MTVQTSTNVAAFVGNGVTTSFPIGFKFNSSADLIVEATNTVTGVTTPLSLNSDYTVTGAGDENGGTITFTAAPLSVETVKVTRHVDLLQLTDLRNQGKFYAEVHEDVFDKLIMIDQQQQTEINAANDKSDEALSAANAANEKSDQAVAKADQNLVDMQAQYDAFEQGASLVVIGDYAAGLVVDGYNKVFRKDGEFYRAAASLDLSYTLTGNWATESVNFVSVGDNVLRQELAGVGGAGLVGWIRSPLASAIASAGQMLSAQAINVWEFAEAVTDKPTLIDPATWDWTPAIQAAHDAGHEHLLIPAGTFHVKSVSVSHNFRVFGFGTAARLVHFPDAVPGVGALVMFEVVAHDLKLTVDNLLLDGNEANQTAGYPYGYLIRATNVTGGSNARLSVVIHNCDLVNMCQAAISMDGDTASDAYEELVVENCRFLDGRQGIGRSTELGIDSFGPDYITLTDKVYARIVNNSFIYSRPLAASTETTTAQFPPVGVRITKREGLTNADACRVLIAGNYFYGCGRGERMTPAVERPEDGLGVIDFYARGRAIRIIGNHFEASQGSPVRGKTNCDMVIVQGNVIDGAAGNPGISVVPNTYADQQGRVIIQGNIVKDVAYHGISVVGASGAITHEPPANTRRYVLDVMILDNLVDNVDTWNPGFQTADATGILVRNARSVRITGNTARVVEANGIVVRGTGGQYNSENVQVQGNLVEYPGAVGILTEQSLAGAVDISGNTVIGAVGFGINAGAASGVGANLTLAANTVRGADGYGIYSRYFQAVSANGNHVEQITGLSRGYRIDDAGSVKLTGNTVGTGVDTPHSLAAGTQGIFAESCNSWNPNISYATAAPTAGAWAKGAVVWNSSPDSGEAAGWVCTASGTPGTWKSFGSIAA